VGVLDLIDRRQVYDFLYYMFKPFIISLLFLFVCFANADEIIGKVVSVADADTITVLDASNTQHKIRFDGIDAPEKGQDYGTKATEALKLAIGGNQVRVITTGKDKYGREIGTVFVADKNLNQWLVGNGWAWHYKKYSKDAELAELETKARTARAGLWADAKAPIAPWDYRSLVKQQAAVKKGGAVPLGYWLNTSSNSRHNSTCRYFQNTSKGRTCEKNEGKACGICGG
jgi:endonuclease YncB( thermonuclease family)